MRRTFKVRRTLIPHVFTFLVQLTSGAEVPAKLDGLTAPELETLLDEALVVTSLPEFMAR